MTVKDFASINRSNLEFGHKNFPEKIKNPFTPLDKSSVFKISTDNKPRDYIT
jgi:hypothetical protein